MREQVFEQDRLPGIGSIGEVFDDRVVKRKLALFDEHHDGCGDKLLARRP